MTNIVIPVSNKEESKFLLHLAKKLGYSPFSALSKVSQADIWHNVSSGFLDLDFALARYNTDGSLDSSFSSDGISTSDFSGDDIASSMVIQPDGKIVLAGTSTSDSSGYKDFAVARYLSDTQVTACFTASDTVVCQYAPVQFTSCSTPAGVAHYPCWDFGDGGWAFNTNESLCVNPVWCERRAPSPTIVYSPDNSYSFPHRK